MRVPGCCTRWSGRARSSLKYKLFWAEVSGALGDLGTFVPIAIALTLVNGLDLGTTLVFTGAYNIVTGLLFGIPMPVQPMKSIAAVAISQSDPFSLTEIAAAGLCTAAVLFVLGITGLMDYIQRILPMPVVRGIQLSQGISFGKTAVNYFLHEQDFSTGSSSGSRPWLGLDGMLVSLVALLFIIVITGSGDNYCQHQASTAVLSEASEDVETEAQTSEYSQKTEPSWVGKAEALPTALIVFLVGVVLAGLRKPSVWSSLTFGPSMPHVMAISWSDWKTGFLRGSIPQLPLSILNSVIAVCKLASDLFPDKPISSTAVSTSVGVMNLVGCWFGAMPVCHGAGGLAGQCRFGATSGAAVVILGTAKMTLGLLVGSSLVQILSEFPIGLLGVLLLFSGVELAMACRDQNNRADAFVMLICTVVSFGSNAAWGFGFSIVVYILLKMRGSHYTLWWRLFRDTLFARSVHAPAGYQPCASNIP
ncbi:hypothetical protein KP509_01G093000 [Ceratopteris richardii]|uniref:Molybdate transporter 2 n=1 Tax=Ceratopteris richardii TaxID=49495 RepID=A0A8T2VF85_CERRI|nr:hypothetical protein KP509_01G093000 [Ceratopteris richardii]